MDLPMIVISANDETVSVVDHALRDPYHYLKSERFDLTYEQWAAKAVVAALLAHSEGLGLTCGLPGCMPPPITAEVLAELDQAIAERDGEA